MNRKEAPMAAAAARRPRRLPKSPSCHCRAPSYRGGRRRLLRNLGGGRIDLKRRRRLLPRRHQSSLPWRAAPRRLRRRRSPRRRASAASARCPSSHSSIRRYHTIPSKAGSIQSDYSMTLFRHPKKSQAANINGLFMHALAISYPMMLTPVMVII